MQGGLFRSSIWIWLACLNKQTAGIGCSCKLSNSASVYLSVSACVVDRCVGSAAGRKCKAKRIESALVGRSLSMRKQRTRLSLIYRVRQDMVVAVGVLTKLTERLTKRLRVWCAAMSSYDNYSASDQARLPAELKHISKRRKRNQQGFP